MLKKLYIRVFGELTYRVHVLSSYGQVHTRDFFTIKGVNVFVDEVNQSEYYQYNVIKIEKFREYPVKYKKQVKHRKLGFRSEPNTVMVDVDGHDYSYPQIDDSLSNVVREN